MSVGEWLLLPLLCLYGWGETFNVWVCWRSWVHRPGERVPSPVVVGSPLLVSIGLSASLGTAHALNGPPFGVQPWAWLLSLWGWHVGVLGLSAWGWRHRERALASRHA